ncbi:MAG: 3-dehydroquinate synthase family protein [Myxococcota bacterium]
MTARVTNIPHAQHACRVVIDEDFAGLADALPQALPHPVRRAVVVTDDNVAPAWIDPLKQALDPLPLEVVVRPAGEVHKTVDAWRDLVDCLLDFGVDRQTPVIGLGGGVTTDLAGFAAATALRGVPLVHVPTSLLGMVDASIGGKTGVNHPRGKNLIGAFYAPRLVWIASTTLSTLPDVEVRAGLGEVVKTAAVGDPELLEALTTGPLDWPTIIERCVQVKGRIVTEDEHEAGTRMLLNAGHTIGHALETALGHGTLAHGLAVGLGLIAEAQFAVREGWCDDPTLPDQLQSTLAHLGLPIVRPAMNFDVFKAALRADKKRAGASLRVPLPTRAGLYRVRSLNPDQVERLVHA